MSTIGIGKLASNVDASPLTKSSFNRTLNSFEVVENMTSLTSSPFASKNQARSTPPMYDGPAEIKSPPSIPVKPSVPCLYKIIPNSDNKVNV